MDKNSQLGNRGCSHLGPLLFSSGELKGKGAIDNFYPRSKPSQLERHCRNSPGEARNTERPWRDTARDGRLLNASPIDCLKLHRWILSKRKEANEAFLLILGKGTLDE